MAHKPNVVIGELTLDDIRKAVKQLEQREPPKDYDPTELMSPGCRQKFNEIIKKNFQAKIKTKS